MGSIDKDEAEKYKAKRIEWQKINREHCEKYDLGRKYDREKVRIGVQNDKENDIIGIPDLITDIAKKQKQSFSVHAQNFINKNTQDFDFAFDENFIKPMAYSISKDKIIINPKHTDLQYYNIDESIAHETAHLKDIRNNISENNFDLLKGYMEKTKRYFKNDMAYYGRIVADNEFNSSLCDLVNIFTEGRVRNGGFAHNEDYIKNELNCIREISATLISCDLTDNKTVNNLVQNIKPLKEMKEEILKLWDVSK